MEKELEPSKFYAATTEMPASHSVSAIRAMKEVEGQIVMAKKFPRDEIEAINRIKTACKRYPMAKASQYSYPRGGATVNGASIRLAEVLAQSWGNLDFGIREISQGDGESEVEAYCWDLETNTRQTKKFIVKHSMMAKGQIKKLVDPRDIYEKVANDGARRLRACILGIIPSDVVEMALEECDKTLGGKNDMPLIDRIRTMAEAFSKLGVSKEMLESRLEHKLEEMNAQEVTEYGKIFNSIRDNMTKRQDWFKFTGDEVAPETKEVNEAIKNIGKVVQEEPKINPSSTASPEVIPNLSKVNGQPKVKAETAKPSFTI